MMVHGRTTPILASGIPGDPGGNPGDPPIPPTPWDAGGSGGFSGPPLGPPNDPFGPPTDPTAACSLNHTVSVHDIFPNSPLYAAALNGVHTVTAVGGGNWNKTWVDPGTTETFQIQLQQNLQPDGFEWWTIAISGNVSGLIGEWKVSRSQRCPGIGIGILIDAVPDAAGASITLG